MNEMLIRINENGEVAVEENHNGVKSFKRIEADTLLNCIRLSRTQTIYTGLLPKNCISYSHGDNGDKGVCLMFPESKADISYYDTAYFDFPLPRLVFGFCVSFEGRVYGCRMGVTANDDMLRPSTKMYKYPFSNVSGFDICTGNNSMPKCKSMHSLSSLPYYILSMPNNDDHFSHVNNRSGLGMRELLELLKDKAPEYYYSDILVPYQNVTLNDFINKRSVC